MSMKLYQSLVAGTASLASSRVLGLESAAFVLPQDSVPYNSDDLVDLTVALEHDLTDYATIMGRVASLESILSSMQDGKGIGIGHASLIESMVEHQVADTGLDANDHVVPGLEDLLTDPNTVVSTEGIKDTINKLLDAAKKAMKRAFATVGKILGSVRAKGYLVKERLKDTMESVKAGELDMEVASVQLKGLATLLTANDNVPNDAAELVKFLDSQIAISEAIVTGTRKNEDTYFPKVRKAYGRYFDGKITAREAVVEIGKVVTDLADKLPAPLNAAEYDKETIFDYATNRSEFIGGEYVILSNFPRIVKTMKALKKDDDGYSGSYGAMVQALSSRVDNFKRPESFTESKVTPFKVADFTKVCDKILALVESIEKAYKWSEEAEDEFVHWWNIGWDEQPEGKSTYTSRRLLSATVDATFSVHMPFYRHGMVRLMSVADNASKLVEKMAKAQVKKK